MNQDMFGTNGVPTAKLPDVGSRIAGKIAAPCEMRQATDYDTGQPATWPDGNPKMQVVVHIADENDGGTVKRLFVDMGKDLHKKIAFELGKAGKKAPEPGDHLDVSVTGTEPVMSKNGKPLNPRKVHGVVFTPAAKQDSSAVAPF